jgi:hypothetical protein
MFSLLWAKRLELWVSWWWQLVIERVCKMTISGYLCFIYEWVKNETECAWEPHVSFKDPKDISAALSLMVMDTILLICIISILSINFLRGDNQQSKRPWFIAFPDFCGVKTPTWLVWNYSIRRPAHLSASLSTLPAGGRVNWTQGHR